MFFIYFISQEEADLNGLSNVIMKVTRELEDAWWRSESLEQICDRCHYILCKCDFIWNEDCVIC